jgi:hypothetical protein
VRVDVGDETFIRALAGSSHVRLECTQQQAGLNNCAFHQEMQLQSAASAICNGVTVASKTWPWQEARQGELTPVLVASKYGGTEDEAQIMRGALLSARRPTMKPIQASWPARDQKHSWDWLPR